MIQASAPATLMLMGEHAVLHGKHALVAAATPRLFVTLCPREDTKVSIESALGNYETELTALEIHPPFTFVLSLIKQFRDLASRKHTSEGFTLYIQSDFSSTLGLGSSAAVLVATSAVLSLFYFGELSEKEVLFQHAYQSLLEVQGRGSGADLAAAIWGGIIEYRQTPFGVQKLLPSSILPSSSDLDLEQGQREGWRVPQRDQGEDLFEQALPFAPAQDQAPLPPITLIYSGYKIPTPQVIERVETARLQHPAYFESLFSAIDDAVEQAKQALLQGNLQEFASALNANQQRMVDLGVSDPILNEIVAALNAQPEILAAKISGSGLGDCVLGIGKLSSDLLPWQTLPVQLSQKGLEVHQALPQTKRRPL